MFHSIRASTPPAVGCQVCLGVFLRTYLRRCTAVVEHDGYECSTHSMQARRQQPQRHINLRGECPQTNRRRRYTEVVEHYGDHGVPHLPCGHAVHTYCCNSCVRRTRGWPRAKVVEQYGDQGVPHHPCGHMTELEAKFAFCWCGECGQSAGGRRARRVWNAVATTPFHHQKKTLHLAGSRLHGGCEQTGGHAIVQQPPFHRRRRQF